MNFWILDEREVWHRAAIEAATARGFTARRVFRGDEVTDGVGFIRPHADWRVLPGNREDFRTMAARLTMIQDAVQVELYEDKSGQFARWSDWMPDTWRFTGRAEAMAFADTVDLPIVSKADVGASSSNVRIIGKRDELRRHIDALFGSGITVNHGARCPTTKQMGYALLQRCIPHDVTWRVNAIGGGRAVFKRYCYPDRMVAQTGNVEPVMRLDAGMESLLEFADRFFAHAGTRWCALDILKDGNTWRLLETSLAWPWPSPGTCNEAPIFRTRRRWLEMFDAMFDEFERGAWA